MSRLDVGGHSSLSCYTVAAVLAVVQQVSCFPTPRFHFDNSFWLLFFTNALARAVSCYRRRAAAVLTLPFDRLALVMTLITPVHVLSKPDAWYSSTVMRLCCWWFLICFQFSRTSRSLQHGFMHRGHCILPWPRLRKLTLSDRRRRASQARATELIGRLRAARHSCQRPSNPAVRASCHP